MLGLTQIVADQATPDAPDEWSTSNVSLRLAGAPAPAPAWPARPGHVAKAGMNISGAGDLYPSEAFGPPPVSLHGRISN